MIATKQLSSQSPQDEMKKILRDLLLFEGPTAEKLAQVVLSDYSEELAEALSPPPAPPQPGAAPPQPPPTVGGGPEVDGEFSAELLKRMERLTPRQRRAIPLIVRSRGEGKTWEDILKGEDKVCNWRTFWDGKRGWYHQELFREVLGQAQREYDAAVLRTSVQDAAEGLRRAAPLASDGLMELIRGMSEAVAEMRALVSEDEPGLFKKDELALRFRAVQGLVRQGRAAAVAVLDRADIETAVKGQGGADERFAALLAELRGEE